MWNKIILQLGSFKVHLNIVISRQLACNVWQWVPEELISHKDRHSGDALSLEAGVIKISQVLSAAGYHSGRQ